jgi:cobalamin synthase
LNEQDPKEQSAVSIAPNTTAEEQRKAESQRQISAIWEKTQMKVALSVIWVSLLVSGVLATLGKYLGTPDLQLAAIVFLFGVANLVTGFYFGRTNHQRVGGVGGDQAGTR